MTTKKKTTKTKAKAKAKPAPAPERELSPTNPPINISRVDVFMTIRVADETTDEQISDLDDNIETMENDSIDGDTERLYEAAKDHLAEAELNISAKLDGDYSIERHITVKRKSDQ